MRWSGRITAPTDPNASRPWAERLAALLGAGHDVYAYFNNDWYGHAVRDAELLRRDLVTDVLDIENLGDQIAL